jgi:hypothetical protein
LHKRAVSIANHYKELADKMATVEDCEHVQNGFGRTIFEKLCLEVEKPEGMEPIQCEPRMSSKRHLEAVACLTEDGKELECQHDGCKTLDCLEIHGNAVRHGQFYNRVVELRPSGKIIFVKDKARHLKPTTLIWREDGTVEEGTTIGLGKVGEIYDGDLRFNGKAVHKTTLPDLVADGHLTVEQLGTMQVLCKQHNLAVERSIDREREERRKHFAAAYKAEMRKARLRPRSEKKNLIDLFMRTHSREKFCFYTAVDEVQLRLLALDHFAEEDDAAVVDLASLVPDDGIRSGLKAVANRGNSKGSPMLLVSTSRKHLKTCDHKLWRDDKWIATVYLKESLNKRGEPYGTLSCAYCETSRNTPIKNRKYQENRKKYRENRKRKRA